MSVNLQDTSVFDPSQNPTNLESGYELSPQIISGLALDKSVRISTAVLPDNFRLACCAGSLNGSLNQSAIGYWTTSRNATGISDSTELFDYGNEIGQAPFISSKTANFTIKWILGTPAANHVKFNYSSRPHGYHYIWTEQPRMTATDCTPVFEKANASVTVEPSTGAVLDFAILGMPQRDAAATSDNYTPHNVSNLSQLRGDYHPNDALNLSLR